MPIRDAARIFRTARLRKLLAASNKAFTAAFGFPVDNDLAFSLLAIPRKARVDSKGADGKTDFEKNVGAVSNLLAEVPAGASVRIIGITADSFAEPDILLSAHVDSDTGYFGERLAAARRQLVQTWIARSSRVSFDARRTDIIGALAVAAQLFGQAQGNPRKVLAIYSDMRQDTAEVNLNVKGKETGVRAGSSSDTPDLKGVDIYVLGADAKDSTRAGWEQLRLYWSSYFQQANANLCFYSLVREPPDF
jgi:hypothetical protein